MRTRTWFALSAVLACSAWFTVGSSGCGSSDGTASGPPKPGYQTDGGGGSAGLDGGWVLDSSAGSGPVDHCGDNPICHESTTGPTGNPPGQFPLPSDPTPPDNVGADGVGRDENGYLVLDSTSHSFDFLWIANDTAYGVGFVSKLSTKAFPQPPTYREVARYVTFTCKSDKVNGSNEDVVLGQQHPEALCADGVHGCCAAAKVAGGQAGVNVYQNRPSRTAIDINGDAWVANRAHSPSPLQSSVTKIANTETDCIDRNGNGKIDTSRDVNADGIITTDCDDDNVPDNAATVCTGGRSLEFYGLDDECVLFTTNTGLPGQIGRPLALGPGIAQPRSWGSSDAWAGTWKDGTLYRIQGKTGAIIDTVKMQDQQGVVAQPYGAAVDRYGILWAPNLGGHELFYFDTAIPAMQGMVKNPNGGGGFYGIAIDGYQGPNPDGGSQIAVQQIWLGEVNGSGAYRYRPVRTAGFPGIGTGTWGWARFQDGSSQGRGIGVDNRAPKSYVWVALDGYVVGPPAAIGRAPTDIPDGVTLLGAESTFPTGQSGTLGAGVANDLDVWGINQGTSTATHFNVDKDGKVVGQPDTVPLDDKPEADENFCKSTQDTCKPHPYTYSDFTGFGLRNFTVPYGIYSWIQPGCLGGKKTRWLKVYWDAITPGGTEISVQARSAHDKDDLSAASYTGKFKVSPADLLVKQAPGPLDPNPADYLQVEFQFSTDNNEVSPKLKSFQIVYECMEGGPQ